MLQCLFYIKHDEQLNVVIINVMSNDVVMISMICKSKVQLQLVSKLKLKHYIPDSRQLLYTEAKLRRQIPTS